MGRKIPGRKHRGIRDPSKQLAARLESLKDKINAPPINPDDQYIPKSLSRVIELKDKTKKGEFNKKKKKLPKEAKKTNNSELIQKRGESDKSFLRRVDNACEIAIQEAAFEKKYGVEIKKNPETGKVEEVVKKKKDEIDILMQKARKQQTDKKVKKKKKVDVTEPRLTKSEKRKLKLKVKKEKKLMSKVDDFDKYKDNVKFGEVVHKPPTLPLPKKGGEKVVARPGVRDLHLKSLLKLQKASDVSVSSVAVLRKTSNKTIDKKGKRKDLPVGVRRQLDKQQREIIEAYKQLKERKLRVT